MALASQLAYVEVSASVAAAARNRRIGARGRVRAAALLDDLWEQMVSVDVDATIAESAAELARRHLLSGADGVHLATAVETGAVLATWDRRLFVAAEAAGVPAVGYG